MFSIPCTNWIVSDTGFSVQLLGRTGMKYREGKKTMHIESEILMTDAPSIVVWKSSVKVWESPHNKEEITAEKRVEILNNICAALQWRNTTVHIQWP